MYRLHNNFFISVLFTKGLWDMKITVNAMPGQSPKYSLTDLDAETVKLLRKSLVINHWYGNFQGDWEEYLCEDLCERMNNIAA